MCILAWVTMNLLFTLFSCFNMSNVRVWMKNDDVEKVNPIGRINAKDFTGDIVCECSSTDDKTLILSSWKCAMDGFSFPDVVEYSE